MAAEPVIIRPQPASKGELRSERPILVTRNDETTYLDHGDPSRRDGEGHALFIWAFSSNGAQRSLPKAIVDLIALEGQVASAFESLLVAALADSRIASGEWQLRLDFLARHGAELCELVVRKEHERGKLSGIDKLADIDLEVCVLTEHFDSERFLQTTGLGSESGRTIN